MGEVITMNLDYKQIGANIARRRKELHLKQIEVCERAEINDKYLSCIETARSIPSLEVFLRICSALEATPDQILLGTVNNSAAVQMNSALLERYHQLTPEKQRFCLHFIDLLLNEI